MAELVRTFCPRCGRDSDTKIAVTPENAKYKCPECGSIHYGIPKQRGPHRTCFRCELLFGDNWVPAALADWERIPSDNICTVCEEEIAKMEDTVKRGGVYWRCEDCSTTGTFPPDHSIAIEARKKLGAPAPDKLGLDLNKDNCPVCNKIIMGLDDPTLT